MKKCKITVLLIVAIINLSCTSKNYKELDKFVFTDKNSSFSLEVPSSWDLVEENEDDYTLVEIHSNWKYDIGMIITSRELEEQELKLDSLELINRMIGSSVDHTKSLGHKLIDVGKTYELKNGYPTFAIVSVSESKGEVLSLWGTVVKNRNYMVLISTLDKEASDELSDVVGQIIDSFRILN